jgi:predicted phage tail protein
METTASAQQAAGAAGWSSDGSLMVMAGKSFIIFGVLFLLSDAVEDHRGVSGVSVVSEFLEFLVRP